MIDTIRRGIQCIFCEGKIERHFLLVSFKKVSVFYPAGRLGMWLISLVAKGSQQIVAASLFAIALLRHF